MLLRLGQCRRSPTHMNCFKLLQSRGCCRQWVARVDSCQAWRMDNRETECKLTFSTDLSFLLLLLLLYCLLPPFLVLKLVAAAVVCVCV